MAKERGKRKQSIDLDTDLLKEMVTMAFQGSPANKLTTEDIYKAVFKNFPNVGSQKKAKLQKLKTSIRTVLSRYECFSKMERAIKGNYWQFNEDVSGEAKRKRAPRIPPPETDTTSDSKSEDIQMDTVPTKRRESRRKKGNKASATVTKTQEKAKEKDQSESETKLNEQDKETDKTEDSVNDDQSKRVSPDPVQPKEQPTETPASVVEEKNDTPIPVQPSKSVEIDSGKIETTKEELMRSENGINGVTTSVSGHKAMPDQVSHPLPHNSHSAFGRPSPSNSPFGHLPPSNTHFGQPSPSNHSFGSPSPHNNSYGQPSPSNNPFGPPPPPNYPFGGYCAPNSQFGLHSSQLGYSTSHFGYSSVPIGMPNNHFGYSSVPSSQFYPSPSTHPFGLASPFHYPTGHPNNLSPYNAAGSLPHSPNRF